MPESAVINGASQNRMAGEHSPASTLSVRLWRLLRLLASLKLTLMGLLGLAMATLGAARGLDATGWLVAAPLALLAVNLAAAIWVTPLFRVKPALFGFHVGLMSLFIALAASQLTRFKGHFEITEGQAFDPALIKVDRQPFITPDLPMREAFHQGSLSVQYAPDMVRRETESLIHFPTGERYQASDGRPLVIGDTRFYLTHNKGFSLVVDWYGRDGRITQMGTINFPSYPRLLNSQSVQWQTPGGERLEMRLRPRTIPREQAWVLDQAKSANVVWVTDGHGTEQRLVPGEELNLANGKLRLQKLSLWIGYRVFHDPSLFWLFASAIVTLSLLGAHLWIRITSLQMDPLASEERHR
ncbi:MAG: hypothetical protein KDI83_02955 [Gammaproteobacteria bacterium]|nr:hypothetical protein [Gammaproteobacteria bacterium]